MVDSTGAMLMHLVQQAQSRIQSQIVRVRQQKSLRGVVGLIHPEVPGHLRSLVRGTQTERDLRRACEQAATRIVERQLGELKGLSEADSRKRFTQLYATEWQFLRGNFPRLFREIEHERLAHQKGTPA
jgi:hypothetical protein